MDLGQFADFIKKKAQAKHNPLCRQTGTELNERRKMVATYEQLPGPNERAGAQGGAQGRASKRKNGPGDQQCSAVPQPVAKLDSPGAPAVAQHGTAWCNGVTTKFDGLDAAGRHGYLMAQAADVPAMAVCYGGAAWEGEACTTYAALAEQIAQRTGGEVVYVPHLTVRVPPGHGDVQLEPCLAKELGFACRPREGGGLEVQLWGHGDTVTERQVLRAMVCEPPAPPAPLVHGAEVRLLDLSGAFDEAQALYALRREGGEKAREAALRLQQLGRDNTLLEHLSSIVCGATLVGVVVRLRARALPGWLCTADRVHCHAPGRAPLACGAQWFHVHGLLRGALAKLEDGDAWVLVARLVESVLVLTSSVAVGGAPRQLCLGLARTLTEKHGAELGDWYEGAVDAVPPRHVDAVSEVRSHLEKVLDEVHRALAQQGELWLVRAVCAPDECATCERLPGDVAALTLKPGGETHGDVVLHRSPVPPHLAPLLPPLLPLLRATSASDANELLHFHRHGYVPPVVRGVDGPTLLRLWSHLCTVLEKEGRDEDGMAGGGHWAEHRRKGAAQLKWLAKAVHALQATLRDTCAQLWERQQELREALREEGAATDGPRGRDRGLLSPPAPAPALPRELKQRVEAAMRWEAGAAVVVQEEAQRVRVVERAGVRVSEKQTLLRRVEVGDGLAVCAVHELRLDWVEWMLGSMQYVHGEVEAFTTEMEQARTIDMMYA